MPRPKSTKPPSRTKRWNDAAGRMKNAAEEMTRLRDEAVEVLDERKGNQTELERARETAHWPEHIQEQIKLYETALEDLKEVQQEYSEWYENMPEALQGGATGEKLQEIQDLDLDIEPDFDLNIEEGQYELDDNFDDLLEKAEEADNMELPRGFGRD